MANKDSYSRRISSLEAKKGYVFVLKDKLSFFPHIGKEFNLHSDKVDKTARVESYHCTCRGPQLPHDHYFIRWDGLKFGDKLSFEKDEKNPEKYHISVGR